MLAFILLYVNIIKNRPQEYLPDSSLITIVILIITIFPILKRTLKVPLIWQSGSISLDKLLILMNKNTENENCEAMGLVKIGKIEFAQVTYCYNKNVNVIQQLSFCIHPNQLTHVRSISSKGKSTIFKLILGLYQPIEGSILIDGHDINQFQAKSLRKNISMMASDLPLLGDTIFEAISYSRKFEKRISAKKLLDELGFFLLGPINIDLEYKIGECGENLSFAQVRILLIARTLLTRKKIILLDDPLIGLDMKLKKLVCSKINELKKSHTIVIVDSSNESMLQIDSVIDI